jgi:hypothetical protein
VCKEKRAATGISVQQVEKNGLRISDIIDASAIDFDEPCTA